MSVTQSLFDSANLLLARAREHREELSRRSKAFFDDNPYVKHIELDRKVGLYVLKARLPRDLPASLFPVAADAFNNLRHALDQAVCACALAKDAAVELQGISFAFGRDPSDFNKNMKSSRNKLAPEITAAIAALTPYKRGNGYDGGDDKFWALNELCRTNKHRALIALMGGVREMNVNLASVFMPGPYMRPHWNSEKNELIAGVADHPDKLNYELGLTFFVAIGDVEIFKGWPALRVIDVLADKVQAVVTNLESESRRLFPNAV